MNILFVTDVFPFPPHTGSAIITYHWARHLVLRHTVFVLSALPPGDSKAAQRLQGMNIREVRHSEPLIRPRGIRHAAALIPMAMHRVRRGELLAMVDDCVGACGADVVVLVSAGLGVLLPSRLFGRPVVFVPYDAESVNFELRARCGEGVIRRAYFRIEAMKWRFVEARYYPLADLCVAVSEYDAEAISRRWSISDKLRIKVIPNGVDIGEFAPLPQAEISNRIAISGNMHASDTVLSVRWFLEAILPRIRRRIPEATVDVVGRDPPTALRGFATRVGGVRLSGYVPDIRPYLAQASVYVAPIRLGTGVKNRVLEAMSMGKPVVATPLGVRGLRVQQGRDVVIAASEDEFADAVVDLLRSRESRLKLGQAAREAVVAHHSWSIIDDRVERMLSEVAQNGT